MSKIEDLYNLVTPLAESLHLKIWGIDMIGAGRPTVRIFVETEQNNSQNAENDQNSPNSPNSNVTENSENIEDSENTEFNSQAGVNIDQCAHLSRLVGINLEAEEFFDFPYVLEVSSPGLERTFFNLQQLEAYLGSELEFALEEPTTQVNGRKRFMAVLKSVDLQNNTFTADFEGQIIEVAWDNVKKNRLVYKFPENNKNKAKSKNNNS